MLDWIFIIPLFLGIWISLVVIPQIGIDVIKSVAESFQNKRREGKSKAPKQF